MKYYEESLRVARLKLTISWTRSPKAVRRAICLSRIEIENFLAPLRLQSLQCKLIPLHCVLC